MDIKRTVLWIVFSFSLLMLWDNWMRYNGKASMFFPIPATQQAKHATGAATPANKSDIPTAIAPPSATSSIASAPNTQTAAVGERITITTDVVKADIDTAGGKLVRLELLRHKDTADPTRNVVLFDT